MKILFDRSLYYKKLSQIANRFQNHSFLHEEGSHIIADVLANMLRPFQECLIYGYAPSLQFQNASNIKRANASNALSFPEYKLDLTYDEENIDLPESKFDLIASNLTLQSVNNLPQALKKYYNALTPDGLFIATLVGQRSLIELRQACINADIKLKGGVSARVSPMIDAESASKLLQHAGFEIPVSQVINLEVEYPFVQALAQDLKYAGLGNILTGRNKKFPPKSFLSTLETEYRLICNHPKELIKATIDIVMILGSKSANP